MPVKGVLGVAMRGQDYLVCLSTDNKVRSNIRVGDALLIAFSRSFAAVNAVAVVSVS